MIFAVAFFGCARTNLPSPENSDKVSQTTKNESTEPEESLTPSEAETTENKEEPTTEAVKPDSSQAPSRQQTTKAPKPTTSGKTESPTAAPETTVPTTAETTTGEQEKPDTKPEPQPAVKKLTVSLKDDKIPVLTTLKKLGAEIEWNSEKTAVTVKYDDASYSFGEKDYKFEETTVEGEATKVKDVIYYCTFGENDSAIKILNTVGASLNISSDETCTVRLFGKSKGKLIVNGKDISSGTNFKFRCTNEELPFLAVAEELGANISWDESKTTVTVTFEGASPIKINTARDDFGLLLPPGTEDGIRIFDNGEIFLDSETARTLLRRVGATYKIDRDLLEIKIDK